MATPDQRSQATIQLLEVLALARLADVEGDEFVEGVREVMAGMESDMESYLGAAATLIVMLADKVGPTREEVLAAVTREIVEEAARQKDNDD